MIRIIKRLSFGLKNLSGRSSSGQIVVYHRGSGVKNRYIVIDYTRELNLKFNFKILDIIYDPIRTANIALILYSNGIFSYIIASSNLIRGMIVSTMLYEYFYIPGSLSFLRYVKKGTIICNLCSLKKKYKPIYVRSAGTAAITLGNYSSKFILVKMPSKEYRLFLSDITVVLGMVSNINHRFSQNRKAGVSRWLNKRPIVRGVAMNPIDHPHGGGEGKSSGGRHPVSPWGRLTKDKIKTRSKFAQLSKNIIKFRD